MITIPTPSFWPFPKFPHISHISHISPTDFPTDFPVSPSDFPVFSPDFPGPRAGAVPAQPVRPKRGRSYTYRVPDELRHLFAPGALNPDGSVKR
jgi:hypothetical protein